MKLIDKDALVTEIEKLKEENKPNSKPISEYIQGGIYGFDLAIEKTFGILDTLEVKEVNLEKDVRQILSLYYEGIKHYDDIIKEERKENGGSDLAIKIMDGVVDARELGIQYVIDKLKAQKGE